MAQQGSSMHAIHASAALLLPLRHITYFHLFTITPCHAESGNAKNAYHAAMIYTLRHVKRYKGREGREDAACIEKREREEEQDDRDRKGCCFPLSG